ncbi:MAG TPA: hypothetical protein VFY73_25775 [Ideonella sp.]|uniref:hypothetical protein n=1 Tax=Ideonella sp. TaxID=1929293 RepID=UPI002E2FCD4A|nr:hypothetical protein [Ideonella sp.]HEX5687440.1 hypothetical protein [Ideonella sp.]
MAYGNQEIWRSASVHAHERARQMLHEGAAFDRVMSTLAGLRGQAARDQRTEHADEFGAPRRTAEENLARQFADEEDRDAARSAYSDDELTIRYGARTGMGERYRGEGIRSREAAEGRADEAGEDFRAERQPSRLLDTPGVPTLMGDEQDMLTGLRTMGHTDDGRIALTASVFTTPAEAGESGVEGFWIHTPAQSIPQIMVHVARLHEQMLTAPPGTAVLARIAWWLSHAMAYERGSASITEWYVGAALAHMGHDAQAMPRGLDLVAFRMTEDAFVAWFMQQVAPVPVAPQASNQTDSQPLEPSTSSLMALGRRHPDASSSSASGL